MKYKPGFLTYECECGAVAYIWNSRRGEVPNFVPCTKHRCHQVMSPVYAKFRYKASHNPERFEKVIVDLSYTAALTRARAMRNGASAEDPAVQRLAFSLYKEGQQPHVITGADYLTYKREAEEESIPQQPAKTVVREFRRIPAAYV